ncbi:MAG: hypothetical protein IJT94_01210 [Oscillibacter sp.]|nr:hypothetical protein [Oscillibacter sp.]
MRGGFHIRKEVPNHKGRKDVARPKLALRAGLARAVLRRLELHTPALLIGVQIQILLNLTARVFHTPKITVWRLTPGEALGLYVEFTRRCMAHGGEADRLYREAFQLGARLRRITGFTDSADIERLVFYLYRNLRIEMGGHLPGEILVGACFFSESYTPAHCAIMSHLDSGVMAGLLGGGALIFTERMTEGGKHCAACFTREGERG